MAIVLSNASHAVELPDDMQTEGLYPLITMGTVMQFTMSGGVIVQQTTNRKGQQFKIIAEGAGGVWIPYSTVTALEAMINAGGTFTVAIHDKLITGAWSSPPIDASPVWDVRPPQPDTPYACTLTIIRIS